MPRVAGAASIDVHADVAEFKRLFDKSSQVDKVLKTALRKNIHIAGEKAADVARLEVSGTAGGTVSPHPRHTGLRLAIASGIKVKVMTGNRAGVTITAATSQMPKGKESLVRGWAGRKGWRHPTFQREDAQAGGKSLRRRLTRLATGAHGADKVWVTQVGNPGYFSDSIYEQRDHVREAVEKAMKDAADSLI
jgi:hypothetical protein